MGSADLREIEHDQWIPFLSEFSKAHFGEPVRVRVTGRAGASDADLDGVGHEPTSPLLAIADRFDDGEGERIDVVTGAGRPVSYVVSHPIHVRVADGTAGRPAVVQIEDRDGSRTVLRFLSDRPTVA